MPEFDSTIRYATIPGFTGYAAGSDGSIWSCRTRGNHKKKGIIGTTWRKMSPCRVSGYPAMAIQRDDGKEVTMHVHRLVLLAFVGPPPEGMVCRHFPDGSRANCRLDNLQWGTWKENSNDRIAHGTECKGEDNPTAKLTDAQVVQIRDLHGQGLSQRKIGKLIGTCQANVWYIVHNITRKL